MPARPYVLEETTYATVRAAPYAVAVLPWGATEAHNFHLPYGTDTILAAHVAAEAVRQATDAGARVTVLPAMPFGVQTGQRDVPLCLNVNPSTQAALLRDLVESLALAGVPKLVVLNAHGGNDFRQMIRELQPHTPVFLCTVNWWTVCDGRAYFDVPGDHAGELETAAMLHAAPGLVRPLTEAGPGTARTFRIAALREGWAWTPRHWPSVTDDTGVGNPSAATPEKGARFVADAAARLAGFLTELAAADVADLYG
jgi:creatinine amidohydrolase